MFCTKCGTQVAEGKKFYTKCGAELKSTSAPPTTPVVAPSVRAAKGLNAPKIIGYVVALVVLLLLVWIGKAIHDWRSPPELRLAKKAMAAKEWQVAVRYLQSLKIKRRFRKDPDLDFMMGECYARDFEVEEAEKRFASAEFLRPGKYHRRAAGVYVDVIREGLATEPITQWSSDERMFGILGLKIISEVAVRHDPPVAKEIGQLILGAATKPGNEAADYNTLEQCLRLACEVAPELKPTAADRSYEFYQKWHAVSTEEDRAMSFLSLAADLDARYKPMLEQARKQQFQSAMGGIWGR